MRYPGFWARLVRAAAEAGVVGGLADWFAVTALFRHPLGLPIPHTAIVPKNKDRIGATLRQFVEQNFLTREILLRKLREAGLAERFAAWLAAPETAPLIADWLTKLAPQILAGIEKSEILRLLARTAGERLGAAARAPGRGLGDVVMRSGAADALIDALSARGTKWLNENDQRIQAIVETKSRWWVPKTINRRIAKAVIDGLSEVFAELSQPGSERRRELQRELLGFLGDLASSPEWSERIDAAKERVLAHPRLRAWLDRLWHDLSDSFLRDLESPSPKTRATLERAIRALARFVATDETVMTHVNAAVERLALTVVVRRHQIAGVIEEVVRRWDAATMSERLELVVGSDLQYIRMNGTLVGAGVGALIFGASQLAGLQ
jgi:uncharacterized membrane-anchored protein YjiN (DUF445 family)